MSFLQYEKDLSLYNHIYKNQCSPSLLYSPIQNMPKCGKTAIVGIKQITFHDI